METANLTKNFSFKRGSKAVVFKMATDNAEHSPEKVLWCHTTTDVVAGGKVTYRLAYDGSLHDQACKIGASITYHYARQSSRESLVNNFYRLGYWVAVPIEEITEERPIEFWGEVFRTEVLAYFNQNVVAYVPRNDDQSDLVAKYIESINTFKNTITSSPLPKEMTVEEWNEARLALIEPAMQKLFTSQ
jgi:hypothetical protein